MKKILIALLLVSFPVASFAQTAEVVDTTKPVVVHAYCTNNKERVYWGIENTNSLPVTVSLYRSTSVEGERVIDRQNGIMTAPKVIQAGQTYDWATTINPAFPERSVLYVEHDGKTVRAEPSMIVCGSETLFDAPVGSSDLSASPARFFTPTVEVDNSAQIAQLKAQIALLMQLMELLNEMNKMPTQADTPVTAL